MRVNRIDLDIQTPLKQKISAVADTGADIDCISGVAALRYRKYAQPLKHALRIRTGGGYIWCKEYVPMIVRNRHKFLKLNLYIIWDLPYDFLVGNPSLKALGYELVQRAMTTYHHHREDIEVNEDILYPDLPKETEVTDLNLENVKISDRDKKLKDFILEQLQEHHNVISKNEFDIGKIPDAEFHIKFKDNIHVEPIQCSEYPHNVLHTDEIERQFTHLYHHGLIRESESPWRFPTFIVPKKTGDARIVFDYRRLNEITESISYPLPSIQSLIDKFHGKKYITTLDIKSGYWNIPIYEPDRCKTAFVFNGKLWEWCVMPFGQKMLPHIFKR